LIHDLSVIFGNKAKQKETLALLCLKCFGSCCSWKGNRNILVVAKRCLFSGWRSICLYNFFRRQNNLWSGFLPWSSLKSNSGPRRIAGTEGLYHISMDSYIRRLCTCVCTRSMKRGDQYNAPLEKWTG